MQRKLNKKDKMTREQLRDVLKVNFELYKDEPEFFDYITTLVIYLMQYEFDLEKEVRDDSDPADTSREKKIKRNSVFVTSATPLARPNAPGKCPQCDNKVPERTKICPFCLSMIDDRNLS